MHDKIILDLLVPPLFSIACLLEIPIILVEAVIIFLLIERKAFKALVCSICANVLTALLGFIYAPFLPELIFLTTTTIIVLFIALIINILIEAFVLRQFYKSIGIGKILETSVIMNLVSYAIVVFNLMYLL